MNYWLEALECSLDENGGYNQLTKEQREAVAKDLERAHEMYSEHTGSINIPDPRVKEIKALEAKVEREKRKVHCKECAGYGTITESWGTRSSTSKCWKCHGEGRHDP